MPNTCCVPMCTSGYRRKGIVTEKIAMFSTKDPKMQKKWMKFIPRKNYVVSAKSRVCAHHFSECDIIKGYFMHVGGEKIFIEHKNWRLKPEAIPKIFPNCPSHMTKVKSSGRKQKLDDIEEPFSKEIKVSMQPEGKTVTIVTTTVRPTDFTDSNESEEAADSAQDMPLTPTEHIDWETEIGKLTFPSNWSYTKQNDEFHIFKLEKDQQGILEVERYLELCNGIVSYKLKKVVVPQNNELLPSLITSITMLRNVINVFDEMKVCGGVTVDSKNVLEKLKKVEFNEGYEDNDVWRSYSCKRLLQPPPSKFPNARKFTSCQDCRYFKITLRKKIWNLNQLKSLKSLK